MGVKNEPLSPKLLRSLGNLLLEHNLTDIVVLAANISIQCPAGVDWVSSSGAASDGSLISHDFGCIFST